MASVRGKPDEVEFVLVNDIVVLATWRTLVIARWLKVPTVSDVQVMRRHVRAFAARVGMFGALNFVEARDATHMPDDARREVAAVQKEFERSQRCLATVIMGSGFWAATVRGVAAGLALLSGARFPNKVFADAHAASAWVASMLPEIGPVDRGALERAVQQAQQGPGSPLATTA